MIGVDGFDREDYPSGRYGSQTRVVGTGWLNYMRRGMAYGAVRVSQAIGMEMNLLECGAEEKEEDTEEAKQQESALFRRPNLVYPLHSERVLYSVAMAQRLPFPVVDAGLRILRDALLNTLPEYNCQTTERF